MSRQKIVAGNWKMNLNLAEAKQLVSTVCSKLSEFDDAKVIFIPSFPFLSEVKQLMETGKPVFLGAQNCHTHSNGAYTGEVSALQLSAVGCQYVLVGHSERRQYFKEKESDFILKIKQALANNIKPIFCIGETIHERKTNNYFKVITEQLTSVLEHFNEEEFSKFVIAYEPVWAIGTGETATPAQAQEIHEFIRTVIAGVYSENTANKTSILYGGSCNAQNAQELFACKDVDGGLIGGASLKVDDFTKIIYSF